MNLSHVTLRRCGHRVLSVNSTGHARSNQAQCDDVGILSVTRRKLSPTYEEEDSGRDIQESRHWPGHGRDNAGWEDRSRGAGQPGTRKRRDPILRGSCKGGILYYGVPANIYEKQDALLCQRDWLALRQISRKAPAALSPNNWMKTTGRGAWEFDSQGMREPRGQQRFEQQSSGAQGRYRK